MRHRYGVKPHNPPKQDSYIYKKTKWNKFTKILHKDNKINLPDNCNLEIDEIDAYIDKLNKQILDGIEKVIPKYKHKAERSIYITKSIKRLIKYKSFFLTKLHQLQKICINCTNGKQQISKMKALIKDARRKIYTLIQEKTERHWEKTLRKIDHRQPEKFFPILNKIFRPKPLIEAPIIPRKAFRALHHLFYNKYLTQKAKTICYLLLIRPLLTYALRSGGMSAQIK